MLFQWGDFTLHSGDKTWWRLDCDAFTDSEIQLIAKLVAETVGTFHDLAAPKSHPGSSVLKLRVALERYREPRHPGRKTLLVVDDVLTTGNSMREFEPLIGIYDLKGAVIFARGECPEWVTPLFQMPLPISKANIAG